MTSAGEPHPQPKRRVADIDVAGVAEALDDNSADTHWWYDPTTGRVEPGLADHLLLDVDEIENDQRERGLVFIGPSGSRPAYLDMVDFAHAVGDVQASELLTRALDGRGAFRRFRDALDEFDDLRRSWLDFSSAASERRAIDWLADEHLVAGDTGNERDTRSTTMTDALAGVADVTARREHVVASDDLVARWREISDLIDAGHPVALTRNGQIWASIAPATRPTR